MQAVTALVEARCGATRRQVVEEPVGTAETSDEAMVCGGSWWWMVVINAGE